MDACPFEYHAAAASSQFRPAVESECATLVPLPLRRAILFRRSISALALAACASVAACELFAGLKLPEQVDGPSDGGHADAPSGPGDAGELACSPQLPSIHPTALGPDLGRVVFAVQYVASSPNSSAGAQPDRSRLCPSPAIDIDKVFTCAPLDDGGKAPGSCKPRAKQNCDVAGGGDNAGAAAATLVLGASPAAGSDPNDQLAHGSGGILIDITNYNGLDDDADLNVAFIFGLGAIDDAGVVGATPRWDGTDTWIAERGSFLSDDQPAYVAREAYVSGGVLVARFQKTPFSYGGSSTRLEAEELVVTGRIVRPAPGAEPTAFDQGRLEARISMDTTFGYAGGRLANGVALCTPDSGVRQGLLVTICSAADLLRTPEAVDPNQPCDAISYAVGFYATRAQRAPRPSKETVDAAPPQGCPFSPWPPSCDEVGL